MPTMIAEFDDTISADQGPDIPRATLSVRIPRWAHKRMKTGARDAGSTAAELYASVIERFLKDDLQHWSKALLTGPTSSPPTTLTMAKPLALRVRALAEERDIQIVFTAVLLHLDEAPPSAVAA
ncbi:MULTISPECIES: hypothetical protein [unclassified Brevundimonas]|uniref:hypothetical protein n=1 Tax=unclassified Brevundimonas TaxID=2622653 RepID=UPI0025C4A1E9|nr:MULTISPECIES: hypothetical protein [unclassified Brevundimonas]